MRLCLAIVPHPPSILYLQPTDYTQKIGIMKNAKVPTNRTIHRGGMDDESISITVKQQLHPLHAIQ